MVAYNTLEQALSEVGVTLVEINQHPDQYGKNVLVIVAVTNSQQVQALVTAALRRCFTAISELSNSIITKRNKGVKDYHFTGRYRTLSSERVVEDESVVDDVIDGDTKHAESVPETESAASAPKRKGR